jgi:DHA2 family multidrug resistance protein
MTTMYHSQLVEHVTPFNDAMRMPQVAGAMMGALTGSQSSLTQLNNLVTQQAATIAYVNDFLLVTILMALAFPLLALIRAPKTMAPPDPAHAVMD